MTTYRIAIDVRTGEPAEQVDRLARQVFDELVLRLDGMRPASGLRYPRTTYSVTEVRSTAPSGCRARASR